MKKKITPLVILSFVLGLLISTQISAQIEVSNDNNVGVGTVDANSKLNVKNTIREKSLRLHSDFDTSNIYGIENRMQGNSTDQAYGMKTTFIGTGNKVYGVYNLMNKEASLKYGFYNLIAGKGTAEDVYGNYNSLNGDYDEGYGFYNKLVGNGDKVMGFYNTMTGTANDKFGTNNYFSGASDNVHGVYNYISPATTSQYIYGVRNVMYGSKPAGSYGVKKGLDNYIQGKDFDEVYGTTTDIYSLPSNTTIVGTKNYIKVKSNGYTYANKNEMQLTGFQSSGNVYGTYNIFTGYGAPSSVVGNYTSYNANGSSHANTAYGDWVNINSGPSYSYGVHSTVPSGSTHYAGYFIGTVYANGAILSSSDERLKEDINSIKTALTNIKELRPKKYKIKRERNNENSKEHFGFIAQELKEVYPELVQVVAQPGEIKERIISEAQVQIGSEGEEITIPEKRETYQEMDGEPMYAINYIGLIPQLVSAIQEQDQKIESISEFANQIDEKAVELMTTKLVSQENRIKTLETMIAKLLACTDCAELEDIKKNGFDLDLDNLDIRVYPNPARDYVNLEILSEKGGILSIKVFDIQGKLIVKEEMMISNGVNVHRIEIANWTSGTYFINTTFEGVNKSEKVVVE